MVALQSLLSYLPESFVSSEITLKNNLISIKENYGRNETTQNQLPFTVWFTYALNNEHK